MSSAVSFSLQLPHATGLVSDLGHAVQRLASLHGTSLAISEHDAASVMRSSAPRELARNVAYDQRARRGDGVRLFASNLQNEAIQKDASLGVTCAGDPPATVRSC